MASLDELRADVLRAQRNATAKVNRLKKQGVEIAGSAADVRKPAENVNRYNRAQLLSQLAKVNTFNSRSTQFVAGIEGAPISKLSAGVYEITQRASIARANAHLNRVRDAVMPTGNTIGFYQDRVRGKKPGTMQGDFRPIDNQSIPARNFVSEEKLRKMTRTLQKRMSPNYHTKALDAQRQIAEEAMKQWGKKKLLKRLRKLSQHQFDTLFNYTGAPRDLFAKYREILLALKGKKPVVSADESFEDVKEWLAFAEGLPRFAPVVERPAKKKNR